MQFVHTKKWLTIAFIVTAISCKNSTHTESVKADILAANIDSTVSPSDDFFDFACGKWIKNNPIPDDETSWGIANLVYEELYKRKLKINEDAIAAKSKNKIQQQLADFWIAAMDTNKIEQERLTPLDPLLQKIDRAKNVKDIMALTAELHRIGVGVFFSEWVSQDAKNSEQMMYHLYQGGLGMPNRDYYFNTDNKSTHVRELYPSYIAQILRLSGADSIQAKAAAARIMALETNLAKASRKLEDLRDPYANYNKMSMDAFRKSSPSLDWDSTLKKIGLPPLEYVIMGQPEFYRTLNVLIDRTPLQDLKDYLRFHLVNDYADYLNKDLVEAKFDFYARTIKGAEKMRPRWKRVLDEEEDAIGEILGQLFVKEFFSATAKQRYENITEAVREAYKHRIEQLDWMSDSTKQKAIKKLMAIDKKVGYPEKWKDYSTLQIGVRSYADNMMQAHIWQNSYQIAKLGKPVDRTEWEMTPQTYNAYYNPSNNEIVLPAGIFTVPGYRDEELDDALVYGYAAASTIGHEITHGFDDQGRQFDEKGNLQNWWSAEDEKAFNTRAEVLAKQFSNFVVVDTLRINGKATLGENLADLGGILIGLDAFKQTETYKKGQPIAGYTPLQRFFLGYALGWLYQTRDKKLADQLMTDVHSPAKYRVNGPFPNVPDFYKAFSIPATSKMYLPDSARVYLW